MFPRLIIIIGIIVLNNPARAEGTVDQLLTYYSDPYMKSDVEKIAVSVANGSGWSNVELEAIHQTPLYCQPPNLALNGRQVMEILSRTRDEYKDKFGGLPFGMGIVEALMVTYPCRK